MYAHGVYLDVPVCTCMYRDIPCIDRFTSSELLLYKHAVEYRYMTCKYNDIQYTYIWSTYNIYIHTLYISILVWYIQITYKSIPSIYTLISCGKQRLGSLSCKETAVRKDAALQELNRRWAETRWRHKADLTWLKVKCGYEQSTLACKHVQSTYMVCSCIYLYIQCT